jgi:hypothetical protein
VPSESRLVGVRYRSHCLHHGTITACHAPRSSPPALQLRRRTRSLTAVAWRSNSSRRRRST